MSVTDGQNADQSTFNNAYVSKTQDSSMAGELELNDAATASGDTVTNSQAEHNSIASFVGKVLNTAYNVLPTWVTNNFGASTDTLKVRIDGLDASAQNTSEKGIANGYAELDGSGRVPSSQLTTEAFEYLGNWDAGTNTPTLIDGTGTTGDLYRVSVAGTQDLGSGSIDFEIGDNVVYNDSATWDKWDHTERFPNLDNNEALTGRNFADSSDLDLIKIDASDQTIINNVTDVLITGPDLEFGPYTDSGWFWGTPGYGITVPQDSAISHLNISTQDHATDSTDAKIDFSMTTGSKEGSSSTGATGDFYVSTGVNEGSGDTGFVSIQTGETFASGTGNTGSIDLFSGGAVGSGGSGYVQIETGGSQGASGNTGALGLRSGNATSTTGDSGDVVVGSGNSTNDNSGDTLVVTGTAGTTRGAIKLQDGTEGTVGHVWTSTNADGSGEWQAGGGGGADTTLSNITTTVIPTAAHLDPVTDGLGRIGGTRRWERITSSDRVTTNQYLVMDDLAGSNATGRIVGGSSISTAEGTSVGLEITNNFSNGTATTGGVKVGSSNQATTIDTGNVIIESGNSVDGDSGDLVLYPGTPSGTGARGEIVFKDGSEGTSGHIWTSTGTGGEGNWAAAGTPAADSITGAEILLDNDQFLRGRNFADTLDVDLIKVKADDQIQVGNSVPIMTLSTSNVIGGGNLGSSGDPWASLYISKMRTPIDWDSGLGVIKTSPATATFSIDVMTGNSSAGDSGTISVFSGAATGGDSGDLLLETGSASGTRGTINFKDGSEGTSGDVWTSTGTLGEGNWETPAAGANDTLSNLSSPVAINQDMIHASTNKPILQNNVAYTGYRANGTTEVDMLKMRTDDEIQIGSTLGNLVIGSTNVFSPNTLNLGTGANPIDNLILDQMGDRIEFQTDVAQVRTATGTSTFDMAVLTGAASSTTSGQIEILTGAANTASGRIFLSTGASTTTDSGDVELFTGLAASGTRGNITLTCEDVVITATNVDHNQAVNVALVWDSGATGSRPGSPATAEVFFDTTLGHPIWYDGTNWIDATGTTV